MLYSVLAYEIQFKKKNYTKVFIKDKYWDSTVFLSTPRIKVFLWVI